MPEFSIVIPVYNGELSVGRCVESLLKQSFNDFEVICVEDCSTDRSLTLLKDLAARDGRVRVLAQPENRGCARARRRGVLESYGAYVLFADQDDLYLPGALSWLHGQLAAKPVDVLAFDAEVIGAGGACEGEVRGVQRWVSAPDFTLSGREVLDACFLRDEYGYTIWNKAYEGAVARRALALTEDVSVPLGEDNYEYFAIAYCAQSFRGVPGRFVYQYHYGAGFTGQGGLSLAGWKRTSSLSVAANLIRRLLEREGVYWKYEATCIAARQHMVDYAFDRFRVEVAEEDRVEALRIALDHWMYQEVLRGVALLAPDALLLLVSERFGDDAPTTELGRRVNAASQELQELDASIRACWAASDKVRESYESSCVYRIGRKITAPLRRLRG